MPHRELRKNNFLHIEDVYKSYGKNLVLNDIDLSVEAGELCTVVGPSGCGKSTLLRLILGQEQPDSGEILIDGIYAGGGILGDALAVPMNDTDGDGIWEGVATFPASGGNYVFLNSPANGGDWGAKEDLTGLPCADANNWNDRLMPALTSNITVCAIFASCDPCQTPPTGLLNNKENKLNVFPNPSNGLLNISSNNEIANLAIYDILGKEVFSQNINNINSILNIEHFINGVYFLKLNFKDKTSTTLKISKE